MFTSTMRYLSEKDKEWATNEALKIAGEHIIKDSINNRIAIKTNVEYVKSDNYECDRLMKAVVTVDILNVSELENIVIPIDNTLYQPYRKYTRWERFKQFIEGK